MNKKVLITGGTGLVGSELIPMLKAAGWQVAVLSRSKDASAPYEIFEWDHNKDYIEEGAFNNVSAIIHLAGASVAGQRWTAERKEEIFNSRTKTSHLLYKKLSEIDHEVKTFVTASAIGYYGNDTGNSMMRENSPVGHDFLAHVTDAWETATSKITKLGVRLVQLRVGVVLSQKSGALMELIKPPITAPLGKGNQYMSWIHIEDLCNMFKEALEQEKYTGVYNAVGPRPKTNKELTKAAASAFGKPFMPIPVPKLALKILLGEMAEIVLGGSRVSCEKVMSEGFQFKFPKLEEALKDLKSR